MGPTARARLSRRARARLAAEGGFTLPELLVVLAILMIVVTSLSSVLVSATHTELDANLRFQAQAQARAGLDQFRREMHCAGSVTDTNGAALTTGAAYSAVDVQLGSTCPTNVTHAATFYVTWCTSPSTLTSGGHVALYRATSTALPRPTCSSASKVKWADYLTTLTPFCVPSTTVACGGVLKPTSSLPMLHVTLPVNLNGLGSTRDGYNLFDDIALRNGTRS